MLPYVPGNTACVSIETSSHVLNLSVSTYDILNYKAFTCTAASVDMSEICQKLGSWRLLKLGKGDRLRYSLYLLPAYKEYGSFSSSHWTQALGHRSQLQGQQLTQSLAFPPGPFVSGFCVFGLFDFSQVHLLLCSVFSWVVLDPGHTQALDSDVHQISLCCSDAFHFKPREWKVQVKCSLIQVAVYLQNIWEIKELKKGYRKALVSLEEIEEMVFQWAVKRNWFD